MSLTAVGATPLSAQLKESMIAFLRQGATFLKPVFVNDTVQSAFEVKEVERKPDREWGHLTLSATLVNQRGETVLEAFHVYRLRCRSVAAAGS
jgi:3-hydroxybutyryl-CoA dehydratase